MGEKKKKQLTILRHFTKVPSITFALLLSSQPANDKALHRKSSSPLLAMSLFSTTPAPLLFFYVPVSMCLSSFKSNTEKKFRDGNRNEYSKGTASLAYQASVLDTHSSQTFLQWQASLSFSPTRMSMT